MTISANYPAVAPTLNLDFANSQSLDPRISFRRSTTGNYYDADTTVVAEQNLLVQSQNYSVNNWVPYNIFNGTLGSNLVVNGTFTTDTTGWFADRGMTIASVGGRCEATTSTTARNYFAQTITTVVGQKYRIRATVQAGTYTGGIEMSIGGGFNTPATGVVNPTASVTMTGYFTAIATTSNLQFVAGSGLTAGLTFYVDDVELQQQVPAASTAPNGTATAELITVDTMTTSPAYTTVDTSSYMSQAAPTNTSNTPITYSMYVKAGTNNFVALTAFASNTLYATAVFDVSTGALGDIATNNFQVTNISRTITSVGSGWFRCTLTCTFPISAVSSVITSFAPQATGNTFNGNTGVPFNNVAGRTLSIWGAQFEVRSFAGLYTTTITDRITNYIPLLRTAPINEPRFDFNPITRQSLGLLIEQQSTNILTWSQDFTKSTWSKVSCTITPAYTISPSGALDAQLITSSDANNRGPFADTTFFTTNLQYTFSGYVKAANSNAVTLAWGNISGGPTFTFSTASFNTVAGWTTAVQFVGNGWYRLSGTYTYTGATGTGTGLSWQVAGAGNSVIVWGSQVEQNFFATSYIPTQASQVTRASDFVTLTGTNFSNWFNLQQGTVYCSFDVATLGSNMAVWGIDNGGNVGYILQRLNNRLIAFFGSTQLDIGGVAAIPAGSPYSATQQTVYTFNNTIGSLIYSGTSNGLAVGSTTPTPLTFIPTQVSLFKYTNNTNPLTGHVRKFAFYPIALTNTQMQALTGS